MKGEGKDTSGDIEGEREGAWEFGCKENTSRRWRGVAGLPDLAFAVEVRENAATEFLRQRALLRQQLRLQTAQWQTEMRV